MNLYEEESQQWQVKLWTSKGDQEQSHVFYDATLVSLREKVYSWLLENKLTYIRSKMIPYSKSKNHVIEDGKSILEERWEPFIIQSDEHVYREFCNKELDIVPGPAHISCGFVDGKLRLEYVRKTVKHDDPNYVNSALRRGWYILELEKSQDTGHIWYILGHTDGDAF